MKPDGPYHHGALHEALLSSAETILCRDGLAALTLRAIARKAGVSHAAPAHHFKDLSALISELVAVGYERLTEQMRLAYVGQPALQSVAKAYVAFAIDNAALFQLMFRVERLNEGHDRLRAARLSTFQVLREVSGTERGDQIGVDELGIMTAQWCLVHGFADLAANGRIAPLLRLAPDGSGPGELLELAFKHLPR
jgi:AcrR family transcriptional regulator